MISNKNNICCAKHCQMDIILEELSNFEDFNILIVGVGECAYYSKKIKLAKNCLNYSYVFTDEELIFGDLAALYDVLEQLNKNNKICICILTCIPCLINLNIQELRNSYDNVKFILAPDYKKISPYDILEDLYYELFKNSQVGINNNISTWGFDMHPSFECIYNKLSASTHIINNPKYLKLFGYLKENNKINFIDNTIFHQIAFYENNLKTLQLNINDIYMLKSLTNKIPKDKKYFIKGNNAHKLAEYLYNNGITIVGINLNSDNYNIYIKRIMDRLSTEILVNSQVCEDQVTIDLTDFTTEINEKVGFYQLLLMLEIMENQLCLL